MTESVPHSQSSKMFRYLSLALLLLLLCSGGLAALRCESAHGQTVVHRESGASLSHRLVVRVFGQRFTP